MTTKAQLLIHFLHAARRAQQGVAVHTSHYVEFLSRLNPARIAESPVLSKVLHGLHIRFKTNVRGKFQPKFQIWEHLKCKSIFLFPTEKISSPVPHFFIYVGLRTISRYESRHMFVCCTSKFERRKWLIETSGLPYETLVWIKPDRQNTLGKDSFVDCNSCAEFTHEELNLKYQSGQIRYIGEVHDIYFEQLLIGLEKSPRIISAVKQQVGLVKKVLFA